MKKSYETKDGKIEQTEAEYHFFARKHEKKPNQIHPQLDEHFFLFYIF